MLRGGFYFIFWRYGVRFFDNGQLSINHSIVYWNEWLARSDFGLVKCWPEKREESCRLHALIGAGISPYTQFLCFGESCLGFCCATKQLEGHAFVVPGYGKLWIDLYGFVTSL
jgi:hypothetical protein